VICSRCQGTAFRKDGKQKILDIGKKQRLKCKMCGKITIGEWVVFDRKAYDKYKQEQFKKYQEHKKDYTEAKEERGWGGFRLTDL
jgi:hypothetical protein